MSTFEVRVVTIDTIENIPTADAIELVVIGDYRSIVLKGAFKVGDIAVYIPEAAIVPDQILEAIGLFGKLNGKAHNRVKAIKLRGVLSQGICLNPLNEIINWFSTDQLLNMQPGDDVAEILGITKWEPIIPASMSGEVYNAGQALTVNYDIENYKRHPDILVDGEEVVFTEKLHGTFTGIGILPSKDFSSEHFFGEFTIFCKGLGAKGLCFRDVDSNEDNLYVRTIVQADLLSAARQLRENIDDEYGFDVPMFLLGEIFGGGVQDLTYGNKPAQFRLFDVIVGYRGQQHALGFEAKSLVAQQLGVDLVPVLYRGPYSKEVMELHTSGKETVTGSSVHMREGIVITPVEERKVPSIGRVLLKSQSAEYLTRRGNVTEYS